MGTLEMSAASVKQALRTLQRVMTHTIQCREV
jgi:hypothetical protein